MKNSPTCKEFASALGHDQAKAMGIPLTDELLSEWRQANHPEIPDSSDRRDMTYGEQNVNCEIEKHLTGDGYRILVDGQEVGCYGDRETGMAHHALAMGEVQQLREAVDCYKGMKEGVGIRIADLEAQVARLQKFRDAVFAAIIENAGAGEPFAYIWQSKWDKIKTALFVEQPAAETQSRG